MKKADYVKFYQKRLERGLTLMVHPTLTDKDGDPVYKAFNRPGQAEKYGGWQKVSSDVGAPKAVKTVEEAKAEKKDTAPKQAEESAATAEPKEPKKVTPKN